MRLFLGGLGCRVVSGHGEVRVEFQSDSLIFRLHGRRAAAASGLGECLVIAHLGCGTPMEKSSFGFCWEGFCSGLMSYGLRSCSSR